MFKLHSHAAKILNSGVARGNAADSPAVLSHRWQKGYRWNVVPVAGGRNKKANENSFSDKTDEQAHEWNSLQLFKDNHRLVDRQLRISDGGCRR